MNKTEQDGKKYRAFYLLEFLIFSRLKFSKSSTQNHSHRNNYQSTLLWSFFQFVLSIEFISNFASRKSNVKKNIFG